MRRTSCGLVLTYRLVNIDSRTDGRMTGVTVSSLFVCLQPFPGDDTVELLEARYENKPTNEFMHYCLLGIGGEEIQYVCMCYDIQGAYRVNNIVNYHFCICFMAFHYHSRTRCLASVIVLPLVKLQLERKKRKDIFPPKEAKAMSRTRV